MAYPYCLVRLSLQTQPQLQYTIRQTRTHGLTLTASFCKFAYSNDCPQCAFKIYAFALRRNSDSSGNHYLWSLHTVQTLYIPSFNLHTFLKLKTTQFKESYNLVKQRTRVNKFSPYNRHLQSFSHGLQSEKQVRIYIEDNFETSCACHYLYADVKTLIKRSIRNLNVRLHIQSYSSQWQAGPNEDIKLKITAVTSAITRPLLP